MNALIIGGGIIGLSIARELHLAGLRDITLVDQSFPGKEASWAAAGMLAPNAETEQVDSFYRFCLESNELYLGFANDLFTETGIDVGLNLAGTLQLAFDETHAESLSAKYKTQKKAGLPTEFFSKQEILSLEPKISSHVVLGLSYPNDNQVDNRKLLDALIEYCRINKIKIAANEQIKSIIINNNRAVGAQSELQSFMADITILATGSWTSFIEIMNDAPVSVDIKPIRGQMIAFSAKPNALRKVIYGPNCYLVPRADGRILVGATVENAGFAKIVTAEAVSFLRNSATEIMPEIANLEIVESWSGLRPRSIDELPIIGTIDGIDNLLVATGHYRNGILLAPITAKIIVEKITGKSESAYLSVFNPNRFLKN